MGEGGKTRVRTGKSREGAEMGEPPRQGRHLITIELLSPIDFLRLTEAKSCKFRNAGKSPSPFAKLTLGRRAEIADRGGEYSISGDRASLASVKRLESKRYKKLENMRFTYCLKVD